MRGGMISWATYHRDVPGHAGEDNAGDQHDNEDDPGGLLARALVETRPNATPGGAFGASIEARLRPLKLAGAH